MVEVTVVDQEMSVRVAKAKETLVQISLKQLSLFFDHKNNENLHYIKNDLQELMVEMYNFHLL